MTHTLHRTGTPESLSEDYIFVCLPANGINDVGSDPKLQEFLRIALRHNPDNIGSDSSHQGGWFTHTTEEIVDQCHGEAHAVFTNPRDVVEVLKELKKADLGLSVVVSGLTDSVDKICREAGLTRHTVEFSLGVRGKTEKLPPREILDITTMCGHHMVSPNLVKSLADDVRKGTKSPDEAGKELARPCYCGCFNAHRAGKLIARMAGIDKWE